VQNDRKGQNSFPWGNFQFESDLPGIFDGPGRQAEQNRRVIKTGKSLPQLHVP
jgi:hypothetical protein